MGAQASATRSWLQGYRIEATLSSKDHIDLARGADGELGVIKWAPSPRERELLTHERAIYATIPPHGNVLSLLSASSTGLLLECMLGDFRSWSGRDYTNSAIVEAGAQLSQGLAHMHASGIYHGDLKPGNVLWKDGEGTIAIPRQDDRDAWRSLRDDYLELQRQGVRESDLVVKLADFGAATMPGTPGSLSGPHMGTPRYMSPEQAWDEAIDCRSDVFSFGLLLYGLFTGVHAYNSTSDTSSLKDVARMAVLPRARERDHPRAAATPAEEEYGALIRRMIAQCTRRDPMERPDARGIARSLREGIDGIVERHGPRYGGILPAQAGSGSYSWAGARAGQAPGTGEHLPMSALRRIN